MKNSVYFALNGTNNSGNQNSTSVVERKIVSKGIKLSAEAIFTWIKSWLTWKLPENVGKKTEDFYEVSVESGFE